MEFRNKMFEIINRQDLFHCNEIKRREIKGYLIPKSFRYHFENCEIYRQYCCNMGVYPEMINSYEDIEKIPLLPSSFFKNNKVISGGDRNKMRKCTSSGTQGGVSVIYRDEMTINNFFKSSDINIRDMLNLEDTECINLAPPAGEAGTENLWLPYAVDYITEFYKTVYGVENGKLNVDKVCKNMRRIMDEEKNIIMIGPPTLFVRLANYMKEKEIFFDFNSKIMFITAGGWKKFTGERIPHVDFLNLLQECFGNIEMSQCRDIFNMVELNTLISECEMNKKHILPWLEVRPLNPTNLKPVGAGENGVLAFYDPTALSYPCFVWSDDIGRVYKNQECKCGRTTDIFEFERRIITTETRGCALKMDNQFQIGK